MTVSSPPPRSVDALVQAISEEVAVPPVTVLAIARPPLAVRLLVVLAVALIAALAWMSWSMIGGVGVMADAIRQHQRDAEALPTPSPLPDAASLTDDGVFADALRRRPDDAARLHAGRGQVLVASGRWDDAIASFTRAAAVSVAPLPATDRIAHANALLRAGWHREARAAIQSLSFPALAPAELVAAKAVLSDCLLAGREAERTAPSPAQAAPADQPVPARHTPVR